MSAPNIAALALFIFAWVFYERLLAALGRRQGRVVNTDLTVIRVAWMTNLSGRTVRIMDSNLLGSTLNSASFFASSNLLLIAAAAGALSGGENAFDSVSRLEGVQTSRMMFEIQMALVVAALARGLLDFIWSIRQLNYCLAAMGATPDDLDDAGKATFGAVLAKIMNPALSSFSAGVRGYYFALAAAAWLFGPWAFMGATLGGIALLLWRQRSSPAAHAIHEFRQLLESRGRAPPAPPS